MSCLHLLEALQITFLENHLPRAQLSQAQHDFCSLVLFKRPTFNSLIKLSLLSFILLISFSSQTLALNLKSLDPPEITPDFKNKVPSRATVWKKISYIQINLKKTQPKYPMH